MKVLVPLLAIVVTTAVLLGPAVQVVATPTPQSPLLVAAANNTSAPAKLSLTIDGGEIGGNPRFSMGAIFVPQLPIILNITFFNNESASGGMSHTFTIDDSTGKHVIDSGILNPQKTSYLEFTVNSMTNITYNDTSFTPLDPGNGTIQYFCIPHQALGMVGYILLGGSPAPVTQPGSDTLTRAFYIGLLAVAVMLVWVAISYLMIKAPKPRAKTSLERERERRS